MIAHKALLVHNNLHPALSSGEIQFAIGHEFSHYKHRDQLTYPIACCVVPLCVYGSLRFYNHTVQNFLSKIQQRYKPGTNAYRFLQVAKTANGIISCNPITNYLLNTYILNKIEQYRELRADQESATFLKKNDDGVSCFVKMQDPKIRQQFMYICSTPIPVDWKMTAYVLILCAPEFVLSRYFRFQSHPPLKERIAQLLRN